jgi:hypothetical protein
VRAGPILIAASDITRLPLDMVRKSRRPSTGMTRLPRYYEPVRRDCQTCVLDCRSSAEPHAPKKVVAANELVIKGGTGVKHDQRKYKPRSDAVG